LINDQVPSTMTDNDGAQRPLTALPAAPNSLEEPAIVCWTYPSGRQGRGSPLPRSQALAMRQIYESQYPDRRYLVRAAGVGDE
jgi:hypothetical protein